MKKEILLKTKLRKGIMYYNEIEITKDNEKVLQMVLLNIIDLQMIYNKGESHVRNTRVQY